MTAQERAKAWNLLEQHVSKVTDPVLKNAILAELAARAKAEWGYCPANQKIPETKLELEDWQKAFLEDMAVGVKYGISPKNETIEKENRLFMARFVRQGRNLSEIPADIRGKYVDNLYLECLLAYGRDIMAGIEVNK